MECRVLDPDEPLFHDVPRETTVWMSHGDQIQTAASDFIPLAATPTCPIAAVRHRRLPIFGLQFHPEVSHTPYGSLILGNFLDRICANPQDLDDGGVHRAVGDARSVGASGRRSGGVRALGRGRFGRVRGASGEGDRLAGGLRVRRHRVAPRWASGTSVAEAFGEHSQAELRVVDASERFLEALKGVVDPQEKRVRIGHVFVDVFREEARSIAGARFLAQGTLYPDVIESGGAPDGPDRDDQDSP